MAKIAINGFGRIGRLFFRQAFGQKGIEIVAVNDLGDIENLAYLLKYDSVYGRFKGDVGVDGENLIVNGKKIIVLREKEPTNLPWKNLFVQNFNTLAEARQRELQVKKWKSRAAIERMIKHHIFR